MEYYQQQSFVVGSHNELLLEKALDENIQTIEEVVPIIYEQLYQKLKLKEQINPVKMLKLRKILTFIFNQKSNFYEIINCNRQTQIQSFNLFNECFYYQMQNETTDDNTYNYINQVIQLGETTLNFVPSNRPDEIDFGIKGLVKSELYKHHSYQMQQS